ncbi:MAG TPA: guanylate kinase [Fimbriimonadaceae bacterium]|nr:guanylate kinase [Fimbriimonadaceae bacterium]
MPGRLVILSGPSGVGKDTVLDAWRRRNPRIQRVVAATTRAPRSGEIDGVDYQFLTRDRFLEKANCNEMLEFMEVFGNLYGTPVEGMERLLAEGKVAVLKIDVQGALSVMEKRPDAVSIFLLPPSPEELESRLRARSTDDPEDIKLRLQTAHAEIAIGMSHYAYHVVNADVDRAVDDLEAIVNG